MTSYRSLLLLLVVVIATSVASAIHAEGLQEASLDVRSLQGVEEEVRRDDMHLHCHGILLQGRSVFTICWHAYTVAHTRFILCIVPLSTLFTLQRVLQRDLQRKLDIFDPEHDVCSTEVVDVYGTCNTLRFPNCNPSESSICYNRRPQRDNFYADRQPRFYIDYDSVFCYPNSFSGCSSCSPGRYCLSENRCIIDEQNYNCEKWI
jgi:hypothetical protein